MAKARSTRRNRPTETRKRALVVTGSRSEFGLLRPVMDAVKKHRGLELLVVVAGEHLLKPALTVREVEQAYRVAARVPMQRAGDRGRIDHAAATARGMRGFASAFKKLKPDWVVVLGDRIEAFAAASAASIAGIAVCHIHGGDRAEGIADEAMRHAITKLSHLHCAATKLSAERIVKMGERAESVHVTGSPAIDGVDKIRPMGDREAARLGDPWVVVLLHPSGLDAQLEQEWADYAVVQSLMCPGTSAWEGDDAIRRVLFLEPNHDPGHQIISETWKNVGPAQAISHLPRPKFLALLRRLALKRGVLVGNSSAALIESSALGVPSVNLGPRQSGRECSSNVVHVAQADDGLLGGTLIALGQLTFRRLRPSKLFGDGRAGPRIAALLAKTNPQDPGLLRKRNSY